MPIIQIDNLGSPGIIKDIPPHELPINAWSAGKNVRFIDDAVERFRGHDAAFSTTAGAFWLMPWADINTLSWIYGTPTALRQITSASDTDVTRTSGGAYGAGAYPRWSGGILGGVPIANNNALVDPPQSWDGSSDFQNLTNWPFGAGTDADPKWQAKVIRTFKNFLVALYMKEEVTAGATTYPFRLRWSHPADPGTVPTAWVPANTNLAGSAPFSRTTGPLIDCLPLGDVNVVYKEDSTHLMLLGGPFVFQIREAFPEFGMLSQDCARAFKKHHFVVSIGDVIVHNGQTFDSIITKTWRRFLFNDLSQDYYDRTFVRDYPAKEEMWICYVPEGTGDTSPTRALIWNWRNSAWSVRDLEGYPFIGLGIVDRDADPRIIDNQTTILIDDDSSIIDTRQYNPSSWQLLGAQPTKTELHEFDNTNQFDGTDFESYVERTGLALASSPNGGVTVDTQSVKLCQGVYPKVVCEAGVTLDVYVGAQEFISGAVTWQGPFNFDPATMQKVNCRASGRALGYRFRSTSGGKWKLHSVGLDLHVVGSQ